MKITIEPTGNPENYPTVSVSVDGNGMNIDRVIAELIRPALLAWGYQPDTVREAFEMPEDELP